MDQLQIARNPKLGFAPPCIALLASIPEGSNYAHYGLHHPGGVFNLQFSKVARRLLEVTNLVRTFSGVPDLDPLLNAYKPLLFDFSNYLESPYEILLGLCPPVQPPGPKEFIHKWLKNHGYLAGDTFYNAVKDDVVFFRELANQLRHTSKTLRPLLITHMGKGIHIVTYYLEAAKDGAIGPDEDFHMQYEKRIAPNSFNRDLRRMYYCIYKAADVLDRCVREHYQQITGKPLEPNYGRSEDASLYRDLFDAIRSLEPLYFLSEEGLPVPYPIDRVGFDKRVLEFEIQPAPPSPPGRYNYHGTTVADGFSRSFRMFGIGGIPMPKPG